MTDVRVTNPPVTDTRGFTALVLGMALVILLPTLSFRIAVDQAAFAHIGAEILEGRWPYLSTWEGDYPGMMFLQAFEILIFGKSIAMFRVFDLLFQLGTVFFIYRITFRLGSRAGGLLAVGLYCLIYQGYGAWNTAQREGFATLPVLAGYWLFLTADRRPAWRTGLGIGLGLGLSVMFKPTMLALAGFYFPLIPAVRRIHLRPIAVGVAGLVAPALLVIAFYGLVGGLAELYEALVAYQPIYTARLRGTDPLLVHWFRNTLHLGRQTIAVGLAYLPFLGFGRWKRERFCLYVAFLGSVAAVVVQGTFAGYHYLPGLAIGVILIGTAAAALGEIAARRFPAVRPSSDVAVAAALVLVLWPAYFKADSWRRLVRLEFLQPPAPGEFRSGSVFDFTESYEVAQYLRNHTKSSDRIQIWGYEPLVYYLADRDEASRFQITHPLVMRVPGQPLSPMQVRWRQEFIRDVASRRPAYVAVVRDDDWWWAPDRKTSEQLLDDFPEWKHAIATGYARDTTIGRFIVYRRTEGRSE